MAGVLAHPLLVTHCMRDVANRQVQTMSMQDSTLTLLSEGYRKECALKEIRPKVARFIQSHFAPSAPEPAL